MPEEPHVTALLEEIKNLLTPISAHYRPEYEEHLRGERERQAGELRRVVLGDKARQACALMDGSRSQAEVAKGARLDNGTVSKLLGRLMANGLAIREKDGKPRLIFGADELPQIWAGD